ncbi:MAG: M20/M25/M40 family metallo-hydrolase [Trueperaceae bacterium]|nr:MAG: M20/M25/M40 family metallo-hydrolase [Trueperaceae bacterium]
MPTMRDSSLVELASDLIRIPSPSGREEEVARRLLEAFVQLGFDESYIDAAGNAIGVLDRGPGPVVVFNGHIDTVPFGDESLWPYPPLGGVVADSRLWGRGACDMKSAIACMAFAARDAAEVGFSGTLMVTAVVQEEVGGLGARHLSQTLKPDLFILGEPSELKLMLGHRGRVEVEVGFPGRIAHAAKSELGDNALYHVARFLTGLEKLDLPKGGWLKASTVTPTNLRSFPEESANVVPGAARLTVDYRNIFGDEPEAILTRLEKLAPEAEFQIPVEQAVSESGGVRLSFPRINPPYLLAEDHPAVEKARKVLAEKLPASGIPFCEGSWWFATDAPHLALSGAPVIGCGPGNPELAHTTSENVPLEHLHVARGAYKALALAFLEER